jgi:endonuclease/exonuclease/phosphatase family metal-dependent hydrolase
MRKGANNVHKRVLLVLFFFFFGRGFFLIAQPFHILSLNIRYDNPSDGENAWSHRKEELTRYILDSLQPDIICLQEVLHHQLNFLNEHWNAHYQYYGVGREDGHEQGEFAPVFFKKSRWERIAAKTIWLSPTQDQPSKGWDAACERILTVVYLKDIVRQDTVCIFNTHWDHQGAQAREQSAKKLLTEFEKVPKHWRFYGAGDFNAKEDEASILLLKAVWRDLCPLEQRQSSTFNSFQDVEFHSRIDYLWTRKEDERQYQYYQKRKVGKLKFISDHDLIGGELK